ncbi:ATP synthase subunit gamma, mitochondrial [Parasteatoda tepidariorum]|uniref:ATP synthase subunit gamma, mitochondrial n=1 Tax=Parasteatoda tepidariorum TaxID=114398 RepID=UPI000A2C0153|nr:ATP synthase subunit gamma, mitochondrial [Parasteatoda tepidariorum]
MFSAAKAIIFSPCVIQTRNMATLKDIRMRLKSVSNIQKITQSMKMVSAAKYARAERELRQAKPFGEGTKSFYDSAEVKADESKPGTMIIAVTSDRGLCGAVHSSVAKRIRAMISEVSDSSDMKVICIGDKSRAMLRRHFGQNIMAVYSDYGKKPPTFEDATMVADYVINCGFTFEKGLIIFNRFKSVVSYQTTEVPVFSADAISNAEKISIYDSLDADVIKSYQEYSLASMIFYAMKENACTEQSSRMTAMDGASKNAGEMIDKLTMTFNRTRQAVITRELIEIISGAAAL